MASSDDYKQRYWAWFDNYLKVIIGVAVLGAQITFTLIVTDIADPASLGNATPAFDKETTRLIIAISWLFFTCTLGVAVITSLLFVGDHRGRSAPHFDFDFGWIVTFFCSIFSRLERSSCYLWLSLFMCRSWGGFRLFSFRCFLFLSFIFGSLAGKLGCVGIWTRGIFDYLLGGLIKRFSVHVTSQGVAKRDPSTSYVCPIRPDLDRMPPFND
jgi:hypothetical protein